jgi:hypothetical protein
MKEIDPQFQEWVQRARDADILDVASMLGANLRKSGSGEMVGPCPSCGGEDRFQAKPSKGVFLCRGSGVGGDGIAMVQHVRGLAFVPACELILNEPAPRSKGDAPATPVDHEAARLSHDMQRDKEISRFQKDAEDRAKKQKRAQEVFDSAQPISGTLGARYLEARGLKPLKEQAAFLRFLPAHPYYHGEDENGGPRKMGDWPAIVALMRDKTGTGTGLHCTYLDPKFFGKIAVDDPDTAGKKLNPRKMYGTKGLILLSQPRPIMAIGEGIETVLSWYELNQHFDGAIAAAGDLGNISGGATGTIPHPAQRKRIVPNGIPDMARPGMLAALPDDVREVILLGDADADGVNVATHLLVAARRLKAQGISVFVHMAPHQPDGRKWDWNDEVRARAQSGRAGA